MELAEAILSLIIRKVYKLRKRTWFMEIEIIKQEKDEIELKIDNLTTAEILRVYLYENGADFAVWRREHPSKPLLMKIKATNVKKAVADSVSAIKKDCNSLLKDSKK